VAYFTGGRGVGFLRRAEIAGGPPQTLAEAPLPVGNGTWNREGVILFSSGGVIRRVLAAGGEATPITNVNEKGEPITGEDHLGPWFLPDGRHFLYVAVSSDSAIYLAELGSPARTRLISAESKPMYAEPGYILFGRGDTIFAQPFDATALKLTGEPIRVTDGVATLAPAAGPNLSRSANFWVSQTGALVFKSVGAGRGAAPAAGGGPQRSLVWVDRNGVETSEAGTGAFAGIDLGPDGRRFAVHLHEGAGGDIWAFDPDQRRMQRFTFSAGQENSSPVWSPDGKQIAYASQRESQWGLYVRPADGTGTEELVTASAAQKVPMSWSPEGKWLVYVQIGKGSDIWTVPLAGDKKPVPVIDSDFNEDYPQVSPDGKWIAYHSNETGRDEIFIKQFPEGPAKQQVSTGGSIWPRWRGDGRELYFVSAQGVTSVAIDTSGPTPRPGVPRGLFALSGNPNLQGHSEIYHRFAVSSDGQRFLISRPGGGARGAAGGADAVITQLVDGGRAGGAGALADITVVLNWPQLLKQRAK
jgi:dipeptidyl aminopeptidase/acylaminoacyl peptidase